MMTKYQDSLIFSVASLSPLRPVFIANRFDFCIPKSRIEIGGLISLKLFYSIQGSPRSAAEKYTEDVPKFRQLPCRFVRLRF